MTCVVLPSEPLPSVFKCTFSSLFTYAYYLCIHLYEVKYFSKNQHDIQSLHNPINSTAVSLQKLLILTFLP